MQLTGQELTQAPSSLHFAGSITYAPSPCEIAFSGQVDSQAPQEMHSSGIILCAIYLPPLYLNNYNIKYEIISKMVRYNLT